MTSSQSVVSQCVQLAEPFLVSENFYFLQPCDVLFIPPSFQPIYLKHSSTSQSSVCRSYVMPRSLNRFERQNDWFRSEETLKSATFTIGYLKLFVPSELHVLELIACSFVHFTTTNEYSTECLQLLLKNFACDCRYTERPTDSHAIEYHSCRGRCTL